jgi:hypothetical protein
LIANRIFQLNEFDDSIVPKNKDKDSYHIAMHTWTILINIENGDLIDLNAILMQMI